jgi:hypothetical protein
MSILKPFLLQSLPLRDPFLVKLPSNGSITLLWWCIRARVTCTRQYRCVFGKHCVHRAALETLIGCGVPRVLTSGGATTALEVRYDNSHDLAFCLSGQTACFLCIFIRPSPSPWQSQQTAAQRQFLTLKHLVARFGLTLTSTCLGSPDSRRH